MMLIALSLSQHLCQKVTHLGIQHLGLKVLCDWCSIDKSARNGIHHHQLQQSHAD